MALRRREVVLTLIVAFISWAFVVQWIPNLRFVPYSFLIGGLTTVAALAVVVGLLSRGANHDDHKRLAAPTFVSFTSPKAWASETALLHQRSIYKPQPVYPPSSQISESVDELLGLIQHDFVKSWYEKISSGNAFSNDIDNSLRLAIRALIERVSSLDLVEVGVTRILPIVKDHIKNFHDAEHMVRGRNLNRNITESEELDVAIAGKYKDGKLHPAASLAASKTTSLQQQHLRKVVTRLVPQILPESMTTSSSVLVVIRETVSCAVLLPLMQMLSDPDILNQLVELYGKSVIHERKTVQKLRKALDEHSAPKINSQGTSSLPKLVPNDSERQFEKFVRAIRQCSSLLDARRHRSEVSRQLRRATSMSNRDHNYIRRLEVGKKLLDQQVNKLSAQSSDPQAGQVSSERPFLGRENANLRDVLHDASALSYFMEFMDRLNLMTLVQFWIVVDGFRGPLDYDTSHSREKNRTWTESDRQDLGQISEAYLWKPELKISKETQDAVKSFLNAGSDAEWNQYEAARQAVLNAQDDVFAKMKEQHFPKFKSSDMFYKWLESEAAAGAIAMPDGPKSSNGAQWSSPLHPRKEQLATNPTLKDPELRRVALSSSDLAGIATSDSTSKDLRRSLDDSRPRRSFDDSDTRNPLFDDEYQSDSLVQSIQSLGSDGESPSRQELDQSKTEAAVQAALEGFMEEELGNDSLMSARSNDSESEVSARHGLGLDSSTQTKFPDIERGKPSLASLGLLGTPSRRTVFSQNDLFGEDEATWEEDTGEQEQKPVEQEIHEAAPGDLGLSELIQSLTVDIDRLEAQQSVVDSLTKKAELTNNAAELRILRKSKTSLEREIHHKTLQRQQYIVQENDNALYGRATISIKSIMVGNEEDGREFALYVIEVQRRQNFRLPGSGSDDNIEPEKSENLVTWAVARRYSEFHELNKRLRARFPSVGDLEFPRRQVMPTLQKDFLKKRRVALEKYLRELLSRPDVCRSIEFRAFLSQQAIRSINHADAGKLDKQDFITRIYNSVTDGMEEFLGNIPALDQLSFAGQSLISAASSANVYPPTSTSQPPPTLARNSTTAAEAEAEIKAFESMQDPETVTFIKPICDMFVELFEVNKGNNWLRGRALVVVLQQLLGGTVERRVRESFKAYTTHASIARYISLLKDTVWPGGTFRGSPPARSEIDKANSRREAGLVLATLLPDLAGGVVSRSDAAKAGRRIFATMNNERLNQHLLYTILDEFVDAAFGRIGRR